MSNSSNQRFVLDLLETGKIDIGEADWLLDTLDNQPNRRPSSPYQPDGSNKIILEIDADQENLQMVIEKLNQAICPATKQDHKAPLFQRLAQRMTS